MLMNIVVQEALVIVSEKLLETRKLKVQVLEDNATLLNKEYDIKWEAIEWQVIEALILGTKINHQRQTPTNKSRF